MKVNKKSLFDTSGISCTQVILDRSTDSYESRKVTAAFITETTMILAREDASSRGEKADKNSPDIRYGDILISWTDDNGKKHGMHARAGQDAGLQTVIETSDRLIPVPFTGPSMIAARNRLLDTVRGGPDLTEDHSRILSGIQGVFEVIIADDDPDRFAPEIVGRVFLSVMADGADIGMSVEDGDLGMKSRADILRAKIGQINPDHPDALGNAATLSSVMRDAVGANIPPVTRPSTGMTIDEASLRRMIDASDTLRIDVLGTLTRLPPKRISAAAISLDNLPTLDRALASSRLSGGWVDGIRARMNSLTEDLMEGYSCDIDLFSTRGRDLLVVRDAMSQQSNAAYIYSWPTKERLTIANTSDGLVLNISPEEIPDRREIMRLRNALDVAKFGLRVSPGADIMGLTDA